MSKHEWVDFRVNTRTHMALDIHFTYTCSVSKAQIHTSNHTYKTHISCGGAR